MKSQFEQLNALGAGDFQHLNGTLEKHLMGTAELLKKWGAEPVLQTAGLFHAAYGTAGFEQHMVDLTQRQKITEVIGVDAEALVYLYCSCDRSYVFPQFGSAQCIEFKDRFTQTLFSLSQHQASLFCELTAANELELVYASEEFAKEHGKGLFNLFSRMEPYLSYSAIYAYRDVLSKHLASTA